MTITRVCKVTITDYVTPLCPMVEAMARLGHQFSVNDVKGDLVTTYQSGRYGNAEVIALPSPAFLTALAAAIEAITTPVEIDRR